ncbi:MAG: cupin domain-containing protein [Pleurocapsa sp.]
MGLQVYSIQPNLLHNLAGDRPATLKTWQKNSLELTAEGTHFGFVYQGHPTLFRENGENYRLHPRMYFSLPGSGLIKGLNSSGIIIHCPQHKGMFTLGGAIEDRGRFAYIDGGTNSLLIPPLMLGDPCLNAMYFPPGIDQTFHTHPSDRICIIVKGECEIETEEAIRTLHGGDIFAIAANYPHKFRTHSEDLTIVIFHPDSDIGFTHSSNPMLERTIVDGNKASNIPQIQTKLD